MSLDLNNFRSMDARADFSGIFPAFPGAGIPLF